MLAFMLLASACVRAVSILLGADCVGLVVSEPCVVRSQSEWLVKLELSWGGSSHCMAIVIAMAFLFCMGQGFILLRW